MMWRRAEYTDVNDIVNATLELQGEIQGTLPVDQRLFRYHLAVDILQQNWDAGRSLVAVAENQQRFLGYFWLTRGHYNVWNPRETAQFKFIQFWSDLPARLRYRLTCDTLEQGELWCRLHGIPVLISSSMRRDYQAFMRLHQQRGYTVAGSYAWKNLQELA